MRKIARGAMRVGAFRAGPSTQRTTKHTTHSDTRTQKKIYEQKFTPPMITRPLFVVSDGPSHMVSPVAGQCQ